MWQILVPWRGAAIAGRRPFHKHVVEVGRGRELVAPGHDGQCQRPLRRHQGLLRSRSDQDLKTISVPTLVLQGDDDQVVPYKVAGLLQAKLLKNSTLKIFPRDAYHACRRD